MSDDETDIIQALRAIGTALGDYATELKENDPEHVYPIADSLHHINKAIGGPEVSGYADDVGIPITVGFDRLVGIAERIATALESLARGALIDRTRT